MDGADRALRPPKGEIPASVRLTLVLGRGPSIVLALSDVAVFTNGFTFTISLLVRDRAHASYLDEWSAAWEPRSDEHGLELVVGYADGRRHALGPGDETGGVIPLAFLRGWSDDVQVSRTAFVSPLPPGGDVTIACGWQRHGIRRTVSSFPASLLLDARDAVVRPWNE